MGPTKFDKNEWLITLFEITESGFHCTCKVISQAEGLDSVKLKPRSRRDSQCFENVETSFF